MAHPLRLTAVLAHPDDESLGLGGVLAKYAAEGVETFVVTATHGQNGRFGQHRRGTPRHPGADELARIREAELRAAAAELGVREVDMLGYVDGHLDEADPAEVIRRIASSLRRVRPQVIVSFGPDGAYGHPDHVAICQFTTAAVVVAAQPGSSDGREPPHAVSKLYYMAAPEPLWAVYQAAFKKLTSTVDGIERQAQPWPEWQLTTVVDTRAHVPTAWRAIRCHRSQLAGYERLEHLTPEQHEAIWGHQYFYRAFSTVNGGRRRENDLFEGLRDHAPTTTRHDATSGGSR